MIRAVLLILATSSFAVAQTPPKPENLRIDGVTINSFTGEFSGDADSLLPYRDQLTYREASHFLTHVGLGASETEVEQLMQDGLALTVRRLVHGQMNPPYFSDPLSQANQNNKYGQWFRTMVEAENPLHEKVSFILHDVLATSCQAMNNNILDCVNHIEMIRRNALGNWRTMLMEITTDPMMLRWLNGDVNQKGVPDENYSREFWELFSLGEVSRFSIDVPLYNPPDVFESAKAFTGLRRRGFNVVTHDFNDPASGVSRDRFAIVGGEQELQDEEDACAILNADSNSRGFGDICYFDGRWWRTNDLSTVPDINGQNVYQTRAQGVFFNANQIIWDGRLCTLMIELGNLEGDGGGCRGEQEGEFEIQYHEEGEKTIWAGTRYEQVGDFKWDDMVDMTLNVRPEAARWLGMRLFTGLAHNSPSSQAVDILASTIRTNRYSTIEAVEQILLSEAMFSSDARKSRFKDGTKFIGGFIRQTGLTPHAYFYSYGYNQSSFGTVAGRPLSVNGWTHNKPYDGAEKSVYHLGYIKPLTDGISTMLNINSTGYVELLNGIEVSDAPAVVEQLAKVLDVEITQEESATLQEYYLNRAGSDGSLVPVTETEWQDVTGSRVRRQLKGLIWLLVTHRSYAMY